MSSSSEEELDELLRRQVKRQPRNFREKKRIFNIKNPKKFRRPDLSFVHLSESIGSRLEHSRRRNIVLTARQKLLVFHLFLGTNSFYYVIHSCHCISKSTVWYIIYRFVPAILSFAPKFIRWPGQPLGIAAKFRDIAGFPCIAGCVDGSDVPVKSTHNDDDAYVNRHHSNLWISTW